jgi:hypothetical protein
MLLTVSSPESDRERTVVMTDAEAAAGARRAGVPSVQAASGLARYHLGEVLGSGGGGQVRAAEDPMIGRTVAMKRMHAAGAANETAVARFLGEIRLTAGLEHPGVLPVYDLGFDEKGHPFFTMRRFSGRPLTALFGQGPARDREAINQQVTIGIKAGEALAYAHRREIVHRDVKPDNIMVGDFGEVVLIDWGAAMASGDVQRGMAGTPMYMAPEQARGEEADARSDIYALGCTLFHALVGRPPYAPEDEQAFWEGKRAGLIDLPDSAENDHLPSSLRAILLKALATRPADRYVSAEAMVADLRAFQAGLAVSVVHENPLRRLLRFYHSHRQAIHAGVAVTIVLGSVLWLWQRERALARADWRPVLHEDFSRPGVLDSGWRAVHFPRYERLAPIDLAASGWTVQDGALIGDDRPGNVTSLARIDLPGGALRVQWKLTPLITDMNLNCFIGAANRLDGYTIHVGGWGRPDYLALTRGRSGLMDSRIMTAPLHPGTTYQLELELDQGRVRLAIDGVPLLDAVDPDPIPGSEQGGFGFETAWNKVRIDEVQVWVRPLARLVSPLAAADALASAGADSRAASAYFGFARTWPEDPLVPTARLRGARALLRGGLSNEAMPILAELSRHPDPAIAVSARFERLRALAPECDDVALERLMADLAQSHPPRGIARFAVNAAGDAVLARDRDPSAGLVVDLLGRLRRWSAELGVEPGEIESCRRCAERLNELGFHAEVLRLAPDVPGAGAMALINLARFEEVHRRFPQMYWARYHAWNDAGRAREGVAEMADGFWKGRLQLAAGLFADASTAVSDFDRAEALVHLHGSAEAQRLMPTQPSAIAIALLKLGRPEEALSIPGILADQTWDALLQLGRQDQVVAEAPEGSRLLIEARALQAIAALASGQSPPPPAKEVAFRWLREPDWFRQHFAAYVLPSLITWARTGADPRPAWETFARNQTQLCGLRVDHRWSGLLGRMDQAAIRAQPFRGDSHPAIEAALIAAVRADLAGDPQVRTLWQAYLDIAPPTQVVPRAWARLRLR